MVTQISLATFGFIDSGIDGKALADATPGDRGGHQDVCGGFHAVDTSADNGVVRGVAFQSKANVGVSEDACVGVGGHRLRITVISGATRHLRPCARHHIVCRHAGYGQATLGRGYHLVALDG